ncbi:MAG: plastocyanin/azurin family copper-binding protein [Solirubrobacterales bacterium]
MNVGEIEGVQPGQSKSGSFEFTPGKYVMFCNLPAHYKQGMYGSITVD